MAKSFIALAFAAVAFASPLEERNLNCNAVNEIITIMREQSVATPFCSSVLNIPTVTKTLTQTSTPPCKTSTLVTGSVATVTSVSTSVIYGTTTVYPVVAVSTTSTCALGATYIPTTTSAPAGGASKMKRNWPQTSTAIGRPNCLSQFIGSKITSACSCLNIPTPTSVTVTTTTLPVATVTKTIANTAQTTVISLTSSTSFTSTYSATQFYTSTFTILPSPTQTISLPDGEVYGIYPGTDFAGQDIQNFFCYPGGPAAPSPFNPTCASFSDCVAECAYYNDNGLGGSAGTQCGTVVYNEAPDGSSASCYLKTGQTGCGSPNEQTDTGVLLPLVANDVQ